MPLMKVYLNQAVSSFFKRCYAWLHINIATISAVPN